MFDRAIAVRLAEWGGRQERKPLLLRGARQVGKTVTVRQFGERFDCYIELNLERQENRAPFVLQPFALFVSFVARSAFDF